MSSKKIYTYLIIKKKVVTPIDPLKTGIFIKRTCISIFSKIEFVDQSKPCTQIYLHNIASCIKLQLPIVILKKNNPFRHASS